MGPPLKRKKQQQQEQGPKRRVAAMRQRLESLGHVLCEHSGRLYCTSCGFAAKPRQQLNWVRRGLCTQELPTVQPQQQSNTGFTLAQGTQQLHSSHRLAVHRGAWWCWSCGKYATYRPLHLAKPCCGGNPTGQRNLARVRRGLCPKPGADWPLPAQGREVPAEK